jgi:hypothetical protein
MVLGIIRKATKVVDKLAHTLGSTRYLYIIRCNKGYTTNGINGIVKKKEKITFLKKIDIELGYIHLFYYICSVRK